MNKPPSYPHFAQDWLAGTAHLSLECQGAYKRLCDHEWIDGPLPNDHAKLARLLGVTPRRFEKIWADLSDHFLVGVDGRLYNDRLERERLIQQGFRLVKSASGKAGAEKRWQGHDPKNGRRHVAAMQLPMAKAVANDGLSSSLSPSAPLTGIPTESRVEARGGDPKSLSELLGKAAKA